MPNTEVTHPDYDHSKFKDMDPGELTKSIMKMQERCAVAVQLNEMLRERIQGDKRNLKKEEKHFRRKQKDAREGWRASEIHDSNNTIKWLEDLESIRGAELPDPEEKIDLVWALEFALELGDNALEMKPQERCIPHEAWTLCERFWASDLHVSHAVSADGRALVIMVGAPYAVLVNEANEMKLQMRIQDTKGSLAFHEDKLRHYALYHGGLNEYIPKSAECPQGDWKPRAQKKQSAAAAAAAATSGMYLGTRTSSDNQDDVIHVHQLTDKRIFPSSLQQRLVMHRLHRLGRVDLAMRKRYRDPLTLVKHLRSSIKKLKPVRGRTLHELLTVAGCYRPGADTVFTPNAAGKHVVYNLSLLVLSDPMFSIDARVPMKFTHKMESMGAECMSYAEVVDAIQIIGEWCDPLLGPGREEHFQGTLLQYFPLHCESELAYLREQWGCFNMLCRTSVRGYNPESGNTPAFGSLENEVHDHHLPLSLHYQPVDEIRAYFGDDIGFFFAWLGKYTEALFLCSLFGLVTMVAQVAVYGSVDKNPLTVAYSIYVGLWSVAFIETWERREHELRFVWGAENLRSIQEPLPQFKGKLEVNMETGKEDVVYKSKCKRALRSAQNYCLILLLMGITCACALKVTQLKDRGGHLTSADPNQTLYQVYKWQIISASLNLLVIVVFGGIYEEVANALNTWENHRTEQEFENALIVKIFVFQFINNYFVLFYIAFLQEYKDPFFGHAGQCHQSCLSELELQLLIVFSGKTVGKQIFFTVKPFVFALVQQLLITFRVNKLIQAAELLGQPLQKVLPGNAAKIIMGATGHLQARLGLSEGQREADEAVQQLQRTRSEEDNEDELPPLDSPLQDKAFVEEESEPEPSSAVDAVTDAVTGGLKKVLGVKVTRKTMELHSDNNALQTKLMPYDGTFDDFSDRAIQFGYLVLFAPACPVAPLFAFVNNVIEIRGAGYKLTHGYQRPQWKARDSIGSWFAVLKLLGFVAVVTNASMVTFVGSQMADNQGMDPDLGFDKRIRNAKLFWKFVLFEHAVMMLRFIIIAVSPSEPEWICNARETLEFRKRNTFKTLGEVEMEQMASKEFTEKMIKHKAMLAKMDEAELRKKFNEIDRDQSNSINRLECQQMFDWIDPSMGEDEKQKAFALLDPSGDGDISFEEFKDFITYTELADKGELDAEDS